MASGAASFTGGKYDVAVRQLTAAINSENLSPENAAKALYYRGLAHQRLGNGARAISDLGAALWLGLPGAERLSAMVNRSLAYRSAGLASQADAELAAARKIGGSGEVDQLLAQSGTSAREKAAIASFSTSVSTEQSRAEPAPAPVRETAAASPAPATQTAAAEKPGAWTTTLGSEPPPASGNRLTRWWGSIRGKDEPPHAPPPAATAAAQPQAAPSAWTTRTTASSDAPPAAAESGARYAEAAPATATAAGGSYRLQLTPTRSENEAMALWKQVSSQNPQIASLRPSVQQTDMGNLGTFYRLQIGPFPDKAESLKVCNALKRNGVDCFLVAP